MTTKSKSKNDALRLEVLKTYKIYIGGKFPRTESGRYYIVKDKEGNQLANMCQSSRKDFRNAVVAARSAGGWSAMTAFNRSQILYRIGEMLESRKALFVEELMKMGTSKSAAESEVNSSVDRLIYYAGWCDKYIQVFSTVNPVSSPHFNFSVPEPVGVVSAMCNDKLPLLGLVSIIAPIIAGGNTCVVLASSSAPLCAISFAEVLNSSDVPGGVVNILTGNVSELAEHFSSHMDVNSVIYDGDDPAVCKLIKENASLNVKRVRILKKDWNKAENANPYLIMDFQEIKTTWHPIENIGGTKAGY